MAKSGDTLARCPNTLRLISVSLDFYSVHAQRKKFPCTSILDPLDLIASATALPGIPKGSIYGSIAIDRNAHSDGLRTRIIISS